MTLIRATDISKSYAGVRALDGVSFELEPGEVHALAGENGAGKSTLIKILTGAVEPDSGRIELDGRPAGRLNPHSARELGIAAIYQQPALFPDLTVAENIAMGAEPQSLFRLIHWRARRERCRKLLDMAGAKIDPDTPVRSLSMPEQQIVEIAKALGRNAKVVILDEPTASLSRREVERLFDVIRGLQARGAGLIYISHRLEELREIANRVTVLRDGRLVETRRIAEVTPSELIRLMVGRELPAIFPPPGKPPGESLLAVRGAVEFDLRAGEILGLAGLAGAGRTELAEALFGLRPADRLEMRLRGKPLKIRNPSEAIAAGLAYVPEDRRRHGLILEMPVARNVTLASLGTISRAGLLDFARERAIAEEMRRRLGVKTESVDAAAETLSGGNQQKVVLGRWLAAKPAVLILDEPTQGVDVGSKAEIYAILRDLASGGLAILMISSELAEILGMCDRVAVMRGGAIAGTLDRAQATERSILALALGSAA